MVTNGPRFLLLSLRKKAFTATLVVFSILAILSLHVAKAKSVSGTWWTINNKSTVRDFIHSLMTGGDNHVLQHFFCSRIARVRRYFVFGERSALGAGKKIHLSGCLIHTWHGCPCILSVGKSSCRILCKRNIYRPWCLFAKSTVHHECGLPPGKTILASWPRLNLPNGSRNCCILLVSSG